MNSFKIPKLISGGIITNYFCTSKCRHCLYRCSPSLPKNYIDISMVKNICNILLKKGAPVIHIGGGEPVLRYEKLTEVIKIILAHNIHIEYVETNSSWYTNGESATNILYKLKKAGITSLLMSISPFHNEYIPFYKVLNIIKLAQHMGILIFPWISDFISDIKKFDINRVHKLEEYEKLFGSSYKNAIVNRYWIHPGGRAIDFLEEFYPKTPLKEIMHSAPCHGQLLDTSHFHIDLYGNYIPGLCSGLSINIDDLLSEVSSKKYPILSLLYNRGIKGLFEFAKSEYKFTPKKDLYVNKCHLCLEIRDFLAKETNSQFCELNPKEFYW